MAVRMKVEVMAEKYPSNKKESKDDKGKGGSKGTCKGKGGKGKSAHKGRVMVLSSSGGNDRQAMLCFQAGQVLVW